MLQKSEDRWRALAALLSGFGPSWLPRPSLAPEVLSEDLTGRHRGTAGPQQSGGTRHTLHRAAAPRCVLTVGLRISRQLLAHLATLPQPAPEARPQGAPGPLQDRHPRRGHPCAPYADKKAALVGVSSGSEGQQQGRLGTAQKGEEPWGSGSIEGGGTGPFHSNPCRG